MNGMQVEPLSVVSHVSLKPILDEEGRYWSAQLGWDFRSAADLIQRSAAVRSLPGFVLLGDRAQVLGYNYYVVDRSVGYIGNLFVTCDHACMSSYRLLVERTVSTLRGGSRLRRIECQLFPFNCELPTLFEQLRFQVRRRHFLARNLEGRDLHEPDMSLNEFRLAPWENSFLMPAAEAVHDSYRESPDKGLCSDYQTLRGCIRFLRNLIDGPGCGRFFPQASLAALNPEGRLAAVLVASQIAPGKVMIPQVSVRRAYQGRGLGTLLLKRCFRIAAAEGLDSVSLSVSEVNARAYNLYRRLGFESVKTFHAYVWDRRC